MKFRTACQAGESAVACLSQEHNRMARLVFFNGNSQGLL